MQNRWLTTIIKKLLDRRDLYTSKIMSASALVVARWCRRDRRLSFLEFQSAQGRTLGKRGSNRRENGSLYIQSRYKKKILPSVAQTIGQGETTSGSCCTFVAATDGENFLFSSSSSLHRHIIGGAFAPFFNSTFWEMHILERLSCVCTSALVVNRGRLSLFLSVANYNPDSIRNSHAC